MINEHETVVLPPLNRCENCLFWQENEPDEFGGRTGTCVCHVPVFIGLDENELPMFAQPTTGVNATCGEWNRIHQVHCAEDARVADGQFRWIFPAQDDDETEDNTAAESDPR